MGFIRTILIIVVVVYLLNLIGRYLFPYLIKRQVKKYTDYQEQRENEKGRKKGEVFIDNQTTKKSKKVNDNEGEYVDFEEIK